MLSLVGYLFVSGVFSVHAAEAAALPKISTPKKDVVDTYQGVSVADPYQWLENTADPKVQKWTQAQNARSRKYLDNLPALPVIRETLTKWNEFKSPRYGSVTYKRGVYFALKLDPPKNQPQLVVFSSPDRLNAERVVVDPNAIDHTGKTAMDFYVPSPDGSKVAVSLSVGGSESGTLHIYETQTGRELPDQIARVNNPTAGGSVAWNADASGFYYTRYPVAGERPKEDLEFFQQIYFHKLGAPAKDDVYSLGKDFPRIAEVLLRTSDDGRATLASVANGDGGEFSHYLLNKNGTWTQITRFEDKVVGAEWGVHNDLYLLSRLNSPRGKILKVSISNPELKRAQVVVDESAGVIKEFMPTRDLLYVDEMLGGPSEIHVFDQNKKERGVLTVPPLSDVANLVRLDGDALLFSEQSYVQPEAWYRYDGKNAEFGVSKTAMAFQSPVDFGDISVTREKVISKDGTVVPMSVLMRKGTKLDGTNPALLSAYGGYGISLAPRFSPDIYLWLSRGGVYAVANVRGGGEFGETWHHAGNLTKKQNVFDDFIACAEYLEKAHYTNAKKLAIQGGSNGGLLMGAVLTQRPDLFAAVVSHVGIYDMLRVENDPNGAFNVTEFGTVKNSDHFKAIYAYSPYHHVQAGKKYPPVLLLTGANDGRVNPYHSKKMAARLQEFSRSPVLLRVNFEGGHGIGRSVSQKVAEESDVYAFLFALLGMKP